MTPLERFKKLDDETKLIIYVPFLFAFWWLIGSGIAASCGG